MTYTIYDKLNYVIEDYINLDKLVAIELLKNLAIKKWGVNYKIEERDNKIIVFKGKDFYYIKQDEYSNTVNNKYNRVIVV